MERSKKWSLLDREANKLDKNVECTSTRLAYYTLCRVVIEKHMSVDLSFKVDTGSSYTVIGMDVKQLIPYKDYIKTKRKKETTTGRSVTNTDVPLYSINVDEFHLTEDIVLKNMRLYVSDDIGSNIILGMDILSMFQFAYLFDAHSRLGFFWIFDYENSMKHIIKQAKKQGFCFPRGIASIDSINEGETILDNLSNYSRKESYCNKLKNENTALKDALKQKDTQIELKNQEIKELQRCISSKCTQSDSSVTFISENDMIIDTIQLMYNNAYGCRQTKQGNIEYDIQIIKEHILNTYGVIVEYNTILRVAHNEWNEIRFYNTQG